jgi:hypothetical protein
MIYWNDATLAQLLKSGVISVHPTTSSHHYTPSALDQAKTMASRKDWNRVADVMGEIIKVDRTRIPFYNNLAGSATFNASSGSDTLHFQMLGAGGYGKVWKAVLIFQRFNVFSLHGGQGVERPSLSP